jgi:hypothetical protein
LIQQNPAAIGSEEAIDVPWCLASMNPGVVALGCLEGWSQLDGIHIPGLDFGLHQEVQDTVHLPGHDPEDPDLRLIENGLAPPWNLTPVGLDLDALDGKKLPAPVSQVSGVGIESPLIHGVERDPFDLHLHLVVPAIQPSHGLLGGQMGIFFGLGGFQERGLALIGHVSQQWGSLQNSAIGQAGPVPVILVPLLRSHSNTDPSRLATLLVDHIYFRMSVD